MSLRAAERLAGSANTPSASARSLAVEAEAARVITPGKGVVIGQRYVLARHLAQGGMGSVWIARHRDLDVDVTIKFMDPSLIASPDARMRFEREARVAARLDSQHVVHVHDYGVEDGTPYLVMELLKGESLWTRLARDGVLSVPAAARLLLQMCKALRTAHEAGLVHRDLKPGNIFLARKDEDEVVKILDFGIAKTADLGDAQASTESGVLLGSVHYMSPEQIRSSRTVDHRSDLWSIGVILYRVLGGRLPFPGEKLGDVLVRVCTDSFPPLSSVVPDLPAAIDEFIARALDRDPDKRFQSAAEMAEEFSAMALEAIGPPMAALVPSSSSSMATTAAVPSTPAPAPMPVPTLMPAPALGATLPLIATRAPIAALPTTPARDAHPPSPLEPLSQITSLNVASLPRPRRRESLVLVVMVAAFVLLVLGGGFALLRTAARNEMPLPAAASAEPAAISPSSPSSFPPTELASAPVLTTASVASAPTPAPTTRPSASTGTHHPSGNAGCHPPYVVDARGVRVPKMECL